MMQAFFNAGTKFTLLPKHVKLSLALHPYFYIKLLDINMFYRSGGYVSYRVMVCICIFQIANEVRHLFMSLLGLRIFSFMMSLFKPLPQSTPLPCLLLISACPVTLIPKSYLS